MAKLKIDQETGEIVQQNVMVEADKAPAVILDVSEVKAYHDNPKGLADKIRQQAGFMVFDIGSQKGRDACRSHAANIIRCIAPAAKESQALAETAKKVVKQDLHFRKIFEEEVREIAAFHRRPLTEYEEAVERQKEADRLAEEARIAEEKYLRDWQDAIDYDELFTLRREKERLEEEERNRAIAEDIANKKAWAKDNADGYQFLFADISQLVSKPFDEFKVVILSRVENHKKIEDAKLEAERERIRKEEERKAQEQIQAEKARLAMEELAAKQAEERKRVAAETKRQLEEQQAQRAIVKEKEYLFYDETMDVAGERLGTIRSDNHCNLPAAFKEPEFIPQEITDTDDDYVPESTAPSRATLIKDIARIHFVTYDTAEKWLVDTFK